MILTISGRAGTGKSTVAEAIAKKLKLKHYSTGDLLREIAKEKGIGIIELSRQMEKDPEIDHMLDERQRKLGKEEDNFIIDGRLSAFFIPKAKFKIYLETDDNLRAERILKGHRKLEKVNTLEEMKELIRQREDSEIKRYKNYYGFNCYDPKKYNLVIDTTGLTVEQAADKIVEIIKKKNDFPY